MSKSRIKIAHFEGAGSSWTAGRRATKFIKQGRATLENGQLRFLGPEPGFYERLAAAEFERSVREGRGERVWWNGSRRRPNATFKPGEARS
jgi:hypothetical protein